MNALDAQRRRLCQYVRNTGQVPLLIRDFDDDWSPAGESYRLDLALAGLIELAAIGEPPAAEDGLVLTAAGQALADAAGPTTAG